MSHDDNIDIRHLCPLKHRGHTPAIDPPATMCHAHAVQLRDRVADITRWWDHIDDLAQASGSSSHGGHGLNSKPPMRLDILALTDPHTRDGGDIPPATQILTTTANWIARVRRLTPVASAVAALGLLRTHWVALGDHPDPQAVHGRVWRVWSYLQRQVGEGRHPVGECQEPHPDPQVDGECGGPLFYTPTALNPVTCASCGWDVSQGAIDIYVAQTDLHMWKETEGA